MKKNIGITDRILRVLVAVIIAALYFTNVITGVTGIVLLALAAIFAVTSVLSFCPIYFALGMRTTPKE